MRTPRVNGRRDTSRTTPRLAGSIWKSAICRIALESIVRNEGVDFND